MVSNLVWTPASGGGTQTIQFQVYGSSTWITYQTVGPTISSLGITGLNYNTLYNFRIVNNCPTGSTTVLQGSDIKITCPTLLLTPSDTNVSIQFFGLGGSIDTYTVNLLNANSTAILQTNTLSQPFGSMVTTTFSGLTAITTYNIQVIPSSLTYSNSTCTTVAMMTTNTPTCPAPTGLTANWTGNNANLSWIVQSGVVAQEVWYGQTSAVGNTLPPAVGWNQGANLYGPTANTAVLNNLSQNTKYQFLIREDCSTGASPWTAITSYNLICPTVTVTSHATELDVAISTVNNTALSNIVYSLVLSITDPTTGIILNTVNFTGAGILPNLYQQFIGLTASKSYLITLGYNFGPSGAVTNCYSNTVNTASAAPCTSLTFNIGSVTSTSFTINVTNLSPGDTYDISLDGGSTFPVTNQTAATYMYTVNAGTYQVALRRNCVTGGYNVSPAQSVSVVSLITGTVSMNGTFNASNQFRTEPLWLVFNFNQPLPAAVTFQFGWTRWGAPSHACQESAGWAAYPQGNINTCPFPPTEIGNPPSAPFPVTIPAGVTTYQTGANIVAPGAYQGIAWQNSVSYVAVWVQISGPSNYNANLTLVSGANISATGVNFINIPST